MARFGVRRDDFARLISDTRSIRLPAFGRRTALLTLMLTHLAVGAAILFAPTITFRVATNKIGPHEGDAYSARLPARAWLIYQIRGDSSTWPSASRVRLLEDGNPLGPPHTGHAKIRDRGGGAYSHWERSFVFSVPDGTDPRTNGRVYSIEAPLTLDPRILLFLASIDAIALIIYRKEVRAFVYAHTRALIPVIAASIVALAVLSSLGTFGTITAAATGTPGDMDLAVGVLAHALLACTICVAAWIGSAGLILAFTKDRRKSISSVFLSAFPISIVLLAILTWVALAIPYGKPIAFLLLLVCGSFLSRWHTTRSELARSLLALALIIPFALAFGIWMGLLWHGPTATLSGSPSGDLAFYASASWSLALQPYPLLNFGYEGGAPTYVNILFPAVGAMFVDAPGFDPFLFIAAGGAASYVLLTALALHLYVADRRPERLSLLGGGILILAVLAAMRYPYWVVESIPVVFVPALTISVWWMATLGRKDPRWALLAMLSALLGTALSKIVAASILVPIGAMTLLKTVARWPMKLKSLALAITAGFLIYSTYMIIWYLPSFARTFNFGSEAVRIGGFAYICRDIAILLLGALVFRLSDWTIALVIVFGFLSVLSFSALFHINFVCATLLAGLMSFATVDDSMSLRIHAVTAFVLALPAAMFTDPAGASTGFVWVLCMGCATLAAWALAASTATSKLPYRDVRRALIVTSASAAVVSIVALTGVAKGHIIVDSGWNRGAPELTPDVRDIWLAVRNDTPANSLIFVDQSNEMNSLIGGYNSYSRAGQRRVFVADYILDLKLRNNPTRRREVLAINDGVLDGALRPSAVQTRRKYDGFFAVLPQSRVPASNWEKVHENRTYALYRIPG